MIQTLSLALLIFSVAINLFATAPYTIIGGNPSLKNQEITIFTITNPITKEHSIIKRIKANNNGYFEYTDTIQYTQNITLEYGTIQASVYVSPNYKYHLYLPDYLPKTIDKILNPYFQPIQVDLICDSIKFNNIPKDITSDINYQILEINQRYDTVLSLFNPFFTFNAPYVDSIINAHFNPINTYTDAYVQSYLKYKIGYIKYKTEKKPNDHYIEQYISNQPVAWNQPGYSDIFMATSHQFFTFYQQKYPKSNLQKIIDEDVDSPEKLHSFFKNIPLFTNDTIAEMYLVKGMLDAYFSGEYNKEKMLLWMKNIQKTLTTAVAKSINQYNIFTLTRLTPGYTAPNINLTDINGKNIQLKDLQGNFIYLAICHSDNYQCLKDIKVLNAYHTRFGNTTKIIVAFIDEDLKAAEQIFKNENYKLQYFKINNSLQFIEENNLKIFPTYLFIDKQGNLIMSPAPTPEDGFEMKLFDYLKKQGEI